MTLSRLTKELKGHSLDKILAELYGENDLHANKLRYLELLQNGESGTTEHSPSPRFSFRSRVEQNLAVIIRITTMAGSLLPR